MRIWSVRTARAAVNAMRQSITKCWKEGDLIEIEIIAKDDDFIGDTGDCTHLFAGVLQLLQHPILFGGNVFLSGGIRGEKHRQNAESGRRAHDHLRGRGQNGGL